MFKLFLIFEIYQYWIWYGTIISMIIIEFANKLFGEKPESLIKKRNEI